MDTKALVERSDVRSILMKLIVLTGASSGIEPLIAHGDEVWGTSRNLIRLENVRGVKESWNVNSTEVCIIIGIGCRNYPTGHCIC